MATREENLKKINSQLEMLTDEELDGVAGGNILYSVADGTNPNKSLHITIFNNQSPENIPQIKNKLKFPPL
ncbi:MAG: hypothetical protein SR1Q5_02510 [Quinella sp. 1Q5]|nr:hypothetical protein [Quinella sp. 1Q5]